MEENTSEFFETASNLIPVAPDLCKFSCSLEFTPWSRRTQTSASKHFEHAKVALWLMADRYMLVCIIITTCAGFSIFSTFCNFVIYLL